MRVSRSANLAAFAARVEPFLVAHEAEHNLLLGLLSTMLSASNPYPEYLLAAVTDEEADDGRTQAGVGGDTAPVVCVVIQTPPHNVALSLLAPGANTEAALAALAGDLRRDHATLPGVTAPTALAPIFARAWRAASGQAYQRGIAERIYRLTAVRPVAGVPGGFRRATGSDRALLVAWMQAYSDEALGGYPGGVDGVVEQLLNSSTRAAYLWEDGGQPVSFAAYGNPTPNGIRVGPVYTPPAARGHGYASACVAALSQLLLASGRRFCFLFTDLSNPTSNHIYQTIGYQPVADVDLYTFSVSSPPQEYPLPTPVGRGLGS